MEGIIDGIGEIFDGQMIVDLSSIAKENKHFIQSEKNKIGATKVAVILCLPVARASNL